MADTAKHIGRSVQKSTAMGRDFMSRTGKTRLCLAWCLLVVIACTLIPFTAISATSSGIQIGVDQVGYYPNDPAKVAYVYTTTKSEWFKEFLPLPKTVTFYNLREAATGKAVYAGKLIGGYQDYPEVKVADFSPFTKPGLYYVSAGGTKSYTFQIGNDIYNSAFYKAMRYFTYQRQGDTTLNFEGQPTMMDDGKRSDNGVHQDVVGGWCDDSAYRRWTYCLGYGLLGLPTIQDIGKPKTDILAYNTQGSNSISDFLDEAKWGAAYFLKMQDETTGMLYPYCGGDPPLPTDNIVGNKDDREILVTRDPANNFHTKLFIQYEAASGLAALSREYYDIDRAYSQQLKTAAERIWHYIDTVEANEPIVVDYELSFKIMAGVNMYRMAELYGLSEDTRNTYKSRATEAAAKLLNLQQIGYVGGQSKVRGWFREAPGVFGYPANFASYSGGWMLLSLVTLLDSFPDSKEVTDWRQSVTMYIQDFVKTFAGRNPFGYLPLDLGNDEVAHYTVRKIGNSTLRYRYFSIPGTWFVGNNGGLLSHAAALLAAADSQSLSLDTGTKDFAKKMASRYIHLTHGANPNSLSFVRDVGQSHPPIYVSIRPGLDIPGMVIPGDVGSDADVPTLNSDYNSLEPWTPQNIFYLWAVANYMKIGFNGPEPSEIAVPVLTSAEASRAEVTLKFTTQPNATYYKVKYGTTAGDYQNTTYAMSSPFVLKALPSGKYYFAISAVGPNGESTDSLPKPVTLNQPK